MYSTNAKGEINMKNYYTDKEAIRELQKTGEYRFSELDRKQSKTAATELSNAAMDEDRKNGIESRFGIARDVFGYYYSVCIN